MEELNNIKVLIADDNQTDRMVLSRIVQNIGGQVFEAADGEQALAVFEQCQPDLVLMDVMMPNLNGREAARRIKQHIGEDFVPIIFLTSLTDAQSLADCLACGGDDFLTKPYNHIILQAKIRSFSRMRAMHKTLQRQRDMIAEHNEHLLHEQQVAKAVFDNVAHAGSLSSSNIRYMLSPLSVFNGDVLLAAKKPAGGMHVLLGDFTGHGLPAAIGAMPLAEIFYGMTAKGFAIRDILREINLKLKSILPVGIFCCAVVVDLCTDRKAINVWMGGVPDCFLMRGEDKSLEVLKSSNLPLGVLANEQFRDDLQEFQMDGDDRLFLWSDGILEARNQHGEMFGEQRVLDIFAAADHPTDVFDRIQSTLAEFTAGQQRDDDTTLLELAMMDDSPQGEVDMQMDSGPITGPVDWHMDYHLGVRTLKNFNPLPLMMHIMMEVPGLRLMGGQLYTVLAELFSNAFEHGVLKLDSALKRDADGFIHYYKQREERLAQLDSGHIDISMDHQGDGRSGCLTLVITDSGEGFDFQHYRLPDDAADSHNGAKSSYCGRGIPLVHQICESLTYQERGNKVEAVIRWPLLSERRN